VALPAARRALVLSLVFAAAMPAAAQTPADCGAPGVDDRCELWVSIEDDPDGAAPAQNPTDLAVSPDGSVVYLATMDVAGSGFDSRSRWAISARNAATGAVLWSVREGAPTAYAFPTGVEVSPDGTRIFVTGTRRTTFGDPDGHLTTRAFDAASGLELWTATYDDPGNGVDNARDLVVSPDGSEVYIAGISGTGSNLDFVGLAYDAVTGRELWATRYNGPGNNTDSPFDIALSEDGGTLVLAGWSDGAGEFNIDFGTVAFDTRGPNRGRIRWVARYDRGPGVTPERANAVAISPDGSLVFVGGMSGTFETGDYRFTTVAYDAATGAQRWEAFRNWEGTDFDEITAMAVAPDGSAVYVTGQSTANRQSDIATVAYSATTGTELWNMRESAPEHQTELGKDIVATASGVYVTGPSVQTIAVQSFVHVASFSDQVTVAYAPATGTELWVARLNASTLGVTTGEQLEIGGGRLFVAAHSAENVSQDTDYRDAVVAAYALP
jgi:WD40 repeat protein